MPRIVFDEISILQCDRPWVHVNPATQNQFISIESRSINKDFPEENESGPWWDRTDDPQIKSLLLYRLS